MNLIADLRNTVSGAVIGPDDPTWDQERLAWKLTVNQQPAAVVRVKDAADVAKAVRVAARQHVAVTAQARGHSASDALKGTVLLRMLGLTDIAVDVPGRTVRVGPGVRWNALNTRLAGTGLTSLPGSSGDVSVVGYCLGGGLGWFGRAHGLAANSIKAVELVTADGRELRVTAESEPDLFWALRGGGGSFGIVTAMELELFPAERLYGGSLTFAAESATEVLQSFATATTMAPDDLSLWAWLLHLPDLPQIPEPMRGRWMTRIDAVQLGNEAEAEKVLAPIRAAAPLLDDSMAPFTLDRLGSIAAEPEDPVPGRIRTTQLSGLDGCLIKELTGFVDDRSPLLAMEVRHLGGALAHPIAPGGAVDRVADPFMLLYGGLVLGPDVEVALSATMDDLARRISPWDVHRVVPSLAEEQPVDRIYEPATLTRLRSIKNTYDPADLIRSNFPLGH